MNTAPMRGHGILHKPHNPNDADIDLDAWTIGGHDSLLVEAWFCLYV